MLSFVRLANQIVSSYSVRITNELGNSVDAPLSLVVGEGAGAHADARGRELKAIGKHALCVAKAEARAIKKLASGEDVALLDPVPYRSIGSRCSVGKRDHGGEVRQLDVRGGGSDQERGRNEDGTQ